MADLRVAVDGAFKVPVYSIHTLDDVRTRLACAAQPAHGDAPRARQYDAKHDHTRRGEQRDRGNRSENASD